MKLTQKTCIEFTKMLAAKTAIPGGGGVAALAGAFGAALSSMVVNFSKGKKEFIGMEMQHQDILERSQSLQRQLLNLIEVDAENFLPLSKAYGIKALTKEEKDKKEQILQLALKKACEAPLKMIELIHEGLLLQEVLVDLSSKLIISDVGVGVQMLRGAILSAQLNITINVNLITDYTYKEKITLHTNKLIREGIEIADKIYNQVLKEMGQIGE